MIKSIVSEYLKSIARKKLRKAMRGYRYLKNENKLDEISNIKRDVAAHKIIAENLYPSKFIFGAGLANAEIVIRQYLLERFRYIKFNEELLSYFGGKASIINYPMPKEWQELLINKGFIVNKRMCSLKWNLYILMYFFKGVLTVLKSIVLVVKSNLDDSLKFSGKHTFFIGLSAGNLPQNQEQKKSYDIVSWYEQWSGRVKDIDAICHDVKDVPIGSINELSVVSLSSPIPYDLTIGKTFDYIIWALRACWISLTDIFKGKWYHALILSEAAIAAIIRIQNGNKLASEYMFGTTGVIYRPLWTYEAEKLGAKISLYLYSINSGGWKTKKGYPVTAPGWKPMTWQYYLVWDEYQADFVRREVGESAGVLTVGPIWFHESENEIDPCPVNFIAVFDVQPFRDSRYQLLGVPEEYYTPVVANKFLEDIHSVASKLNVSVAFKRKRDIGKLLHPKYNKFLDELCKAEDFILVPSETSALRVIKKCSVVISMPFSSPAVQARELGKPSIFYDPFASLQKDDRSAHGIEIISGVKNLEEWLFKTYCNITKQEKNSIN